MERGKRVLIVDDDRENIDLLTEYLGKDGHTIATASDGESALHRVRAWKPHLILLDVNMPGMSGLEVIPKIRSLTLDEYASIILVSANNTVEDVTKGLDAGADDYLTKPFRAQDLMPRVKCMLRLKELHDSLRRAQHRIEEMGVADDLTGLLNMRYIYRRGDEEIQRTKRFHKPVSGMVINLDQFSAVNSNFGFAFGNQVLKGIGAEIKKCVRSIDHVGRVGSDEFFVLLIETDLAGAEFVAERVRDAIQRIEFKKEDKHSVKVTACIGVSSLNPSTNEGGMNEIFRTANEALKTAKTAGPNRVEIYSFV